VAGRRVRESADFRLAAVLSVALLTFSYTSVLYHVTDVVGGRTLMIGLVVGSLTFAVVVGRVLRVRTAVFLTALLLGGGLAVYWLSVPESQRALISVGRLVEDTMALLTGLSILRLTQANVWALAVTPGPVFLSWYFAVRGRYGWSVVVGGTTLGLVVLTGDAGAVTTLAGVVGAAGALGFGTFDRYGGSAVQFDTLVVLVTAMIVVSASLSLVPSGAADPVLPSRSSPTVEATLVEADDSVDVLGSIRLSPKVRFTVQSTEGEYWQTATFNRYTGTGWVRAGETRPYADDLRSPPGSSRPLEQTVTARTALGAMPAAWRPVDVEGAVTRDLRVTPQGGLRPRAPIETNDSYTVTSRIPEYTTEQLRRADTDYPDHVEAQYLQLPESTPDRVRQRAAEVAGNESTPYGKATAIETYLESDKAYSLTVEQPSGEIADSFLFEMDAGYCTYYATTMVVMLRSEGVPARFVTGYTSGERAGDEWVVRGLDSHAWVQVYFPDVGWVRFDPTPAGPRQTAERTRLAEARQNAESGVDTSETERNTPTPTPMPTPSDSESQNVTSSQSNDGVVDGDADDPFATPTPTPTSGGGSLPELPSRRVIALWGIALVGVGAGARRTGVTRRLNRAVWLRYQPTGTDPNADAVRAFRRLEYLLERRSRPRAPAETPRAYVRSVAHADDADRVRAVLRAYERARYGDGITRADADDAVRTVTELVHESTYPGRLIGP
jgi:transglutaminase-like putative cysteine protease